jgi:2-polyprenyl-6-methoxyphenol hydroxylase-like FAD-dependent oxidoreductase
MKIVIVGAGLSGLATAIALQKYVQPICQEAFNVTVYDESDRHVVHDKGWNDHSDLRLKNQGAAISLQSNGMRVIRDLDAKLADKVVASGQPCKSFTWKTAGDYLLGREYQELLLISRPVLVSCLCEALSAGVLVYRTVKSVEAEAGQRPVVYFEDGESEEADLVIGADGIRSPVRRSLFDDSKGVRPKYL